MGDLQKATELLLDLAKVTGEAKHTLNAVFLELRQDHRDVADKLLRTVDSATLSSAELLIQCAQAKTALGHEGALELAYEARRRAFRDPDIHFAFVTLFLNRENIEEEALRPERADVDTAVKLRKDQEEKVFVILEVEDISLERGELSPDDDLALKLIGKRSGEQVFLKQTGLEDLAYEVVEIQSKYVAAFQQTLLNFTTWWPTHPALQKADFTDNDFTKLFAALDARDRLISQVMQAYREKGLPLGTISQLTGGSALDVWRTLVGLQGQTLLVATGRSRDLQEEKHRAQGADEIIVELSGVLTIALLNLGDTIANAVKRVIVAQATRDEVLADYSKQFEGAVASSVIGRHEGQYFHHDITDEEREGAREFLDRMRRFLLRCETAPAAGALELGHAESSKITELVGSAAAGTVLAAQHAEIPMWVDDLLLKDVAAAEWEVQGFSVQPALQALRDRATITQAEYVRCIRELILANYFHIAVAADDLWAMLDEDDFLITPAWTTVVQRTLGPSSDLQSSAGVAAALLREAWLSDLPDTRKMFLLDAVLTSVIGQRPNLAASSAALSNAVRQTFALLPLQLDFILRSIALWSGGR
jgi:transcription elongation GreA/GreB family factor